MFLMNSTGHYFDIHVLRHGIANLTMSNVIKCVCKKGQDTQTNHLNGNMRLSSVTVISTAETLTHMVIQYSSNYMNNLLTNAIILSVNSTELTICNVESLIDSVHTLHKTS
jgi:hypothetical protein